MALNIRPFTTMSYIKMAALEARSQLRWMFVTQQVTFHESLCFQGLRRPIPRFGPKCRHDGQVLEQRFYWTQESKGTGFCRERMSQEISLKERKSWINLLNKSGGIKVSILMASEGNEFFLVQKTAVIPGGVSARWASEGVRESCPSFLCFQSSCSVSRTTNQS